jgi:hypothetical protein
MFTSPQNLQIAQQIQADRRRPRSVRPRRSRTWVAAYGYVAGVAMTLIGVWIVR